MWEEHRWEVPTPRDLRSLTIGRIVQDLIGHGFPSAADPEGLLVLGRDEDEWDPAVRLVIDDETLRGFVAAVAGGASEIWPAVAGYRYFLRELGRQLVQQSVPGSVIAVNGRRLETNPARATPDGPLELITLEECSARYGIEPRIDPRLLNPFD